MPVADHEGSLSLYFELKDGEKADLEVVAQAAIAWVAALRAAAAEIDPTAQIKVEIIDAQEGSLRLNTILDWLERQLSRIDEGSGKYWRLRKLAIALAIFVPVTGVPTYDYYFGDHKIELSDEDRQRIDELIKLTQGKPEVEEKKRVFYRSLEKDPSIKGVGVSERKDERPSLIVPSSEFAERGGLWLLQEEDEDEKRTIYPIVDVTLISPILVKKPRVWRFQPEGLPEFSAKMLDQSFLSALEADHIREHLRIGIPMKLRLKVEEQKIGGVWMPLSRAVIEVLSPATAR